MKFQFIIKNSQISFESNLILHFQNKVRYFFLLEGNFRTFQIIQLAAIYNMYNVCIRIQLLTCLYSLFQSVNRLCTQDHILVYSTYFSIYIYTLLPFSMYTRNSTIKNKTIF